MKIWSVKLLAILFTLLVSWGNQAWAEDIFVIVRDDFPDEEFSQSELKNVYMGITLFAGNTRLNPIDQSDKNSIKQTFLKEILNLSPAEYESFWAIRTFGGIIPPPTKRTSQDVVNFVLSKKGTIGYVWENEKPEDGVRVLMVIPGRKS